MKEELVVGGEGQSVLTSCDFLQQRNQINAWVVLYICKCFLYTWCRILIDKMFSLNFYQRLLFHSLEFF